MRECMADGCRDDVPSNGGQMMGDLHLCLFCADRLAAEMDFAIKMADLRLALIDDDSDDF